MVLEHGRKAWLFRGESDGMVLEHGRTKNAQFLKGGEGGDTHDTGEWGRSICPIAPLVPCITCVGAQPL
jgi:hypothetical protein